MTLMDMWKLMVASPIRFHLRHLRSKMVVFCIMVVAAGMKRREWVGGVCLGRNVSGLSYIIYLSVSFGRRHKRRGFLNPGSGRSPGGGQSSPHQYSCLENPHGQRSLAGYSP